MRGVVMGAAMTSSPPVCCVYGYRRAIIFRGGMTIAICYGTIRYSQYKGRYTADA